MHCQFLSHVLKALFFNQNSPKMKLFLQKNAKFLSAGGSAPRPPCLRRLGALLSNPRASGGWGLRPRPPNSPPLRISGDAPERIASGIRVFPCGTQYPWKYKIFPNIALKSNSKNIFYNCTSDYELDHLLSHFTRAIDRLKVLKKKK